MTTCLDCGQIPPRVKIGASALTRGLCSKCYHRHHRKGDLDAVALPAFGARSREQGEKYLSRDGYVMVKHGPRMVAEHRIVMEEILGRPLVRGENVHHVNGLRADNRPENLELWISPQPYGQRLDALLAYVVEHHAEALRELLDERAQASV